MKKIVILILLFAVKANSTQAQSGNSGEEYGHTLNLGTGIGYYGYVNNLIPVLHADYEFDVARDFTIAPFIGLYSYSNNYYWGSNNNPYKNYYYHETVIPIGAKGTYYFDHLLNANSRWDFYLGASLGFDIVSARWDNGYNGDRNYFRGASPFFMDLHAGTEYHLNNRLGLFLDLSTGVSTFGIAVHRKQVSK